MQLPHGVLMILDKLNQHGYEAFLVGGCVRDMIMGLEPHDYDITTSATPQEVEAVFSDLHVIETGLQHGTVTVVYEKEPYEITTYRVESGYSDSRHPDRIAFTRKLEDDLSRRDFTVNAMAYNPSVGIVDCFGGLDDIERKVLCSVGNPVDRFSEDALRILRLLRFASVLGFSIEEKTKEAAIQLKDRLSFVSAERVAIEINKLLCGKGAGKILSEYVDVLGVVIPELVPMKDFDQKNEHHIYDVLTHTAIAVDHVPQDKTVRLAALFHDIGKPLSFSLDDMGVGHFYGHAEYSARIAEVVLDRLKYDNATKNIVVRLVKWHDIQIEPTEKAVKRTLGKMTPVFFDMLIALKRADNLAQNPIYHGRQDYYSELEELKEKILAEQECFSLKDMAINGEDLLQIGFPKGKEMGLLLKELLEKVIDNDLPNQKETLLAYAKEKMMGWK